MSSFPYITGIPNPPNDPSVDAPNMQINTNTVNAWVQVDHIGFGVATGGKHNQVTFPGATTPAPGAQSGLTAVVQNLAGTADNTTAQLFYQNGQAAGAALFALSAIKAYAVISAAGAIVNGFNVSSVSFAIGGGLGVYTITLSLTLPGGANSFGVFALPLQSGNTGVFQYYSGSGNTVNLYFTNTTQIGFCFAVLQI